MNKIKKILHIIDLRNYIFGNITAFIGYTPIIVEIIYNMYPHPKPNPSDFIGEDFIISFIDVLAIHAVICSFIFIILEMLARKYLIPEKFLNYKLNIPFHIPKILGTVFHIIYTIMFYFGMFMSVLMMLFFILAAMDVL